MPPSRAAAHGRPTTRFCSRQTQPVRCFACRRPADSRPSPRSSRPARTIIARRSSFRTGSTSSTTPEGTPQVRGVHVARLDGTETKRLLDADGAAVYARSGHLLFPRQGELLAQSFDATRLALDGEAFRVADSVSVNPGHQPRLALRVSIRTDCVRHGQHPSNAVRLVRSFWPAARNSWYTGSKKPGQSFAVARRQSDRFQPRRRWELGRVADRHARRCKQIHVGALPRLESSLVTGRPADLLPIEHFKHLLTIGYRRHARASRAEQSER